MTLAGALRAGIASLRLDLDAAVQAKLLAYLALLEKWNRTHNLTAVREPERMLSLHLLDSLAAIPQLPRLERLHLADVGSGGGLPGIPLAIARPQWAVTLIESSEKKCAFLRQSAAELRLTNLEVVNSRVENFLPRRRFDVVIARALSELVRFVASSAHLLKQGGRLVAMKGRYPTAELAALPPTVRVLATPELVVPGVDGERHLVIMEATAAGQGA
jgi:16S rRNA (guanine527-N7)-methyltransferase